MILGLESASFSDAGDAAASTLVVHTSVPLGARTFFDARLPLALPYGIVGNAMLGAHHVAVPLRDLWISAGGALGLPLLSGKVYDNDVYELASVPRAAWDLHEVYPSIVPLAGRLVVEGRVGIVWLRGELDPVIYFPFLGGKGVELVLQKAFEVQIGTEWQGGLRLQGVGFPTFKESQARLFFIDRRNQGTDLYQLALEPFFGVERGLLSLRTGLVMPLDAGLGPPFKKSWGFELDLGVRL
ncbi:MAG: hypothetical protein HY908_30435 [Myxococcales bacterium]|nr:hypothetical protein [Myxococcales bacterium]